MSKCTYVSPVDDYTSVTVRAFIVCRILLVNDIIPSNHRVYKVCVVHIMVFCFYACMCYDRH